MIWKTEVIDLTMDEYEITSLAFEGLESGFFACLYLVFAFRN